MKNYIGISRDHSGSMSVIATAAARDYNSNIASIKENSEKEKQDTIISVVECGVGSYGTVQRNVVNSSISALKPIEESAYHAKGGSTPLLDSVGELIELFEKVPDAKDPNVSFLVMVITDGMENSSRRWNATTLGKKIRELQATDHWSFVFRVPRGHSHYLTSLGIPEGNILEWDQSERGMYAATVATQTAMNTYYQARSRGETMTRSFYTTNLNEVSKSTVKSKLVEITDEVEFFDVKPKHDGMQIRDFLLQVNGDFKTGAAFYQLTKTEKEVQDYKQIAIRDKKTGNVYSGTAARNLLGLPHNGTVKIVPGNHGSYDIFIQSTSVNRKLSAGTSVMYWENSASK